MVTEVKERVGGPKRRFTCLDRNDVFHSLKTTSPGMADKKIDYESVLIIEGKASDIDLKHIDTFPSGERLRDAISSEKLESGDVCDLEGGDPVRTSGVRCVGIAGDYYAFLHLTSGTRFWVFKHGQFYVSNIQKRQD